MVKGVREGDDSVWRYTAVILLLHWTNMDGSCVSREMAEIRSRRYATSSHESLAHHSRMKT